MTLSREIFDNIETLIREEKYDEAEGVLIPLLEKYQGNMDIWHNMGVVHQKRKQWDEAIKCFMRCLEVYPTFDNCIYNLAVTFYESGKKEEALQQLRFLLANNPNFYPAIMNAGEICFELKKYREAAEYYDRYMQLFPHKRPIMLPNVINCLQWAESATPDNFSVKLSLYEKLKEIGQEKHANEVKIRALHCDARAFVEKYPNDPIAVGSLITSRIKSCNWLNLDKYISQLRDMINAGGMTEIVFNLIGSTQKEQYLNISSYTEWKYPHRIKYNPKEQLKRKDGKLTIGYLSSDYHENATAYLIAALFEYHDREKFNIIAYSCGIEDNSSMRERIKNGVDKFVNLRGMEVVKAAELIKFDDVDILVDLKGYTQGHCMDIIALRPAPLIVAYLGYPATTGGMCDWILADKHVIPEEEKRWFSEKVYYLPDSYQINDDKCEIAEPLTRKEYGLPEDAIILASFNQPYKITPAVWDMWMNMLRDEPKAILWQYIQGDEALENLRNEAEKAGISAGRIIAAKHIAHAHHLARFKVIDKFLDTFPVSGHTTLSDALRIVPPENIVLPFYTQGASFLSRVAESLIENKDTIFDSIRTTRNIEQAYETIAGQHGL